MKGWLACGMAVLMLMGGRPAWAEGETAVSVEREPAAASSKSDALTLRIRELNKKDEIKGLAFMGGGVLAFGTSFALSVASKEVLPIVGFALVQTGGAAAFSHGLSLYSLGGWEAEELDLYRTIVEPPGGRGKVDRKEMATRLGERWAERSTRAKRIRGWVGVVNAGAIIANLAVGSTRSNMKYVAMGFIGAMSLAGGILDLTSQVQPADYPVLRFNAYAGLEGGLPSLAAALTLRY